MGLIPMTGSEIIDCVDFMSVFQHETYITYNKKLCIIVFSPYSYYKICSNLDIILFKECKFIVIDDFEIWQKLKEFLCGGLSDVTEVY